MANRRIKSNMTMVETLYVMSEGNPIATTCMLKMINDNPSGFLEILYFDGMEIYGKRICKLWNDCCKQDLNKLWKTLEYFKSDKISIKEIHKNLDRVKAKPFI